MKTYHKYKNIPTKYKDRTYQSKLESQYAAYLDKLIQAGTVVGYLLQPKFYFPDGNTYAADFQVFYADGHVEFIDTKGKITDLFTNKMRSMETYYPWLEIKLVFKGDF